MPDREPGLAGAGRPLGEDELLLAQGLDVGVLRGIAGAHRPALAGRDLVEARPSGRRRLGARKEVALKRALLDRAIDIAEREGRAIADAVVEPFEHAAGLLGSVESALDHDPVAVGVRRHPKAALEMSEILVVVAEEETRETIVVEGQRDLGRFVDDPGRRGWRRLDLSSRCRAVRWPQTVLSLRSRRQRRLSAAASPKRLFEPARTIRTGTMSPTRWRSVSSCTACR
jgi:hypothetical protein